MYVKSNMSKSHKLLHLFINRKPMSSMPNQIPGSLPDASLFLCTHSNHFPNCRLFFISVIHSLPHPIVSQTDDCISLITGLCAPTLAPLPTASRIMVLQYKLAYIISLLEILEWFRLSFQTTVYTF